jgi:hypothetical protein
VRKALDEDGLVIEREQDKDRFMVGRDCDHLMTPFQCEVCQMRNISGRDPKPGHREDDLAVEHIRRVSLDAFWAREPKSVYNNSRVVQRVMLTEDRMGWQNKIIPAMGPYPLEDAFGMGAAVAVLDKSMDRGIYETRVQYATFRKVRSALTNLGQAGFGGLGDVIGAYEKNRTWISSVDTHKFYFQRYMTGIHRRVGEEIRRDEPISIEVLKTTHRISDKRWHAEISKTNPNMELLEDIALAGLWFLGGFCTGLRGEEMGLIEFAGTHRSLDHIENQIGDLPPHFDFVIAGRTKGNQVSGAKFKVPCAAVTEGTGLQPGVWAFRYCTILKNKGQQGGFLFPGPLSNYEEMFYGMLEEVQSECPTLIKPTVDVREDFGLARSERRGVTAHAINMKVDRDLIDAVNRWRSERSSLVPALDMSGMYARLDLLKPTVLLFSLAL